MNKIILLVAASFLCVETLPMDVKTGPKLDHFQLADRIERGETLTQLQDLLDKDNVDPELPSAEPYFRFTTPLLAAIREDNVQLVTQLVKLGARVAVPLTNNDSYLHICLREQRPNCEAIAKILIDNGANPEAENGSRQTPGQVAKKPIADTWLKSQLGIAPPPPAAAAAAAASFSTAASAGAKSKKSAAKISANQNNSGSSISWFASRGFAVIVCALIVNKVYADVFNGNADDKDDEDEE